MTVTYNSKVSESGLCTFLKLLSLWRGSIYKLVWKEMAIFLVLFYTLNFIYRFALNEYQKLVFERVTLYCDAFINLIPLSFVLGFFVSTVVQRWWEQFQSIPWPDSAAVSIGTMIIGNDEYGRMLRRTMVRYLNLAAVLVYRAISNPVKRRFPTMEHLVDAGFITTKELKMFSEMPSPHPKWYAPIVWLSNLLTRAYKERRIVDEYSYRALFTLILAYRDNCGGLYAYDWINIPLVYTQVVTLANYTFFFASLMGRQLLDSAKRYPNHEDIYFPIFTFLQFFFYMGWFKVAEELMNPFGEDADDFDINWIIDRNLQVSLLIVDGMHNVVPELEKDIYWDDDQPDLPYTTASQDSRKAPWMGSTANLYLDPEDMAIAQNLEPIPENEPIINYQSGINKFGLGRYSKSKSDLMSFSQPGSRFANAVRRLPKFSEGSAASRFALRREPRKAPAVTLKRPSSEVQTADALARDLENLLDKEADQNGNYSDSDVVPTPNALNASHVLNVRNSLKKRKSESRGTRGVDSPELASSPALTRKQRTLLHLPVTSQHQDTQNLPAKISKTPSTSDLIKKKFSSIMSPNPIGPKQKTMSRFPAAGFGLTRYIHGSGDPVNAFSKFRKSLSFDSELPHEYTSSAAEDKSNNKTDKRRASKLGTTQELETIKSETGPSSENSSSDNEELGYDVTNKLGRLSRKNSKPPTILPLPLDHTSKESESIHPVMESHLPPMEHHMTAAERQALNMGSLLQLRHPMTAADNDTTPTSDDIFIGHRVPLEHSNTIGPIITSVPEIEERDDDDNNKEDDLDHERRNSISISIGGSNFDLSDQSPTSKGS